MPDCDLFKPWDYESVWPELVVPKLGDGSSSELEYFGRRKGSRMTMPLTEKQYEHIKGYWILWHMVEQIERERHATG